MVVIMNDWANCFWELTGAMLIAEERIHIFTVNIMEMITVTHTTENVC